MAVSKRKLIYPMVVLLVLVSLLAIAVFYVQLKDLDALRAIVAQELQTATQRDVQIEGASLDLSEGVGLQLKRVTLKGSSEQEADFTCDQVLVLLKVMPLLNGEVEIQKLIFEGLKVQVTRDPQGNFNFGNLMVGESDRSSATLSSLIQAGLMHNLQVRNSDLWLVDQSITPDSKPLITKIQKMSVSLTRPTRNKLLRVYMNGEIPLAGQAVGSIRLDGKMRVGSDVTNYSQIAVEGQMQIQGIRTPRFKPYLDKVFEQDPGDQAVSLETRFAGTLDGHVKLTGTLSHAGKSPGLAKDSSGVPAGTQGRLEYDLIFNRDNLEFRKLDYHSGDFAIRVRGSFAGFFSEKAWLSVSLSAAPIQIQHSNRYLPFKVFSRQGHERLHALVKKGEVEFVSLQIQGPPTLFAGRPNAEIEKYDSATILIRHGDFGAKEFPLQDVTGKFQFKDGVAQINIQEAGIGRVSIKNIKGTITHPLTAPRVQGTVEAEGAWAPWLHEFEKAGKLPESLGFIKQMSRIQGTGRAVVSVAGPLDHPERMKLSGEVSVEKTGFEFRGWPAPVHNVNGRVYFKNIVPAGPSPAGKPVEPNWNVRLESFSGEIASHYFREVSGESQVLDSLPIKKIKGKIQLGEVKAADLIATPFEGALQPVMENLLFQSGEIDFKYQHIGVGPGNQHPQSQGTLEIRQLFVKHLKGYRPLKELIAEVSFDDSDIRFKVNKGWYGDSAFTLNGVLNEYSGAHPELVAQIRAPAFQNQDFAGLPFLETLEYRGPAEVDLKIHSTDEWIRLDQRVDLTQASYRFQDLLIKPENIGNVLEMSARLKADGRLEIDKAAFELEGNRLEGKGFLKSRDDPLFEFQLGSDRFKVWPASQYIRPLNGALGGQADFHLSVSGHLNHLENTELNGKIHLRRVEYKPENFLEPLRLDADMKLEGEHITIRKGKLETKGSSLFFGGDYRGGETPHIKIQLIGSGLDVDQLVSEEGKPSKGLFKWLGETRVFSRGSGEIFVKINRFKRKPWTLPEVAGKVTFKDQTLETQRLSIGQPGLDQVLVMGKLNLTDINTPKFDTVLISKNTRIEKIFGMFGGLFRGGLSGDNVWMKLKIKSQGGDLKEIAKNLQGRWSFDIRKGRITTGHLLNGAALLFDVPVSPKTFKERDEQHNTGYLQIFGDFPIVNGVGHTDNFMYEDKGDRVSLVGDIDLSRQWLDLIAGVAPFRRVSRVIERIPVLGPIITGGKEGSLVTNYFEVEGSFSDPRIESIPWTSVGKKVLGTLEGIITAPTDLIPKPDPSLK